MTDLVKVGIYAIGFSLLIGMWVLFTIYPIPGFEGIISYIQATLSALTGHVFTLINPSKSS